nr:hypothetical protein [uncultured Mucilaginibacter sp.]
MGYVNSVVSALNKWQCRFAKGFITAYMQLIGNANIPNGDVIRPGTPANAVFL